MKKADIGLIGLAVMGENLVMNMESKGFTVAVYNRTTEKTDRILSFQTEKSYDDGKGRTGRRRHDRTAVAPAG